jgi:solute carrier family 25 S-adenosylmethionine transporter 26
LISNFSLSLNLSALLVPSSALFFLSYDTAKSFFSNSSLPLPIIHGISASVGEALACLIRVPVYNIQNKVQTGHAASSMEIIRQIVTSKKNYSSSPSSETIQSPFIHKSRLFLSPLSSFYRGYFVVLMREIPFSFIQFPIYEKIKAFQQSQSNNDNLDSKTEESSLVSTVPSVIKLALAGSLSGGIAAFLTTPIDVIKTRIMTAKIETSAKKLNAYHIFNEILKKEGPLALFKGVTARVMWISIGGAIYFGAYEQAHHLLDRKAEKNK